MALLLTGFEEFGFNTGAHYVGKWCVAGNVARTIKKPRVAPAGSTNLICLLRV